MKAAETTGVDLSIVITSHAEGLIAHKTMLSVADAITQLEEASITYEVIISVDNGNDETTQYFKRYANTPHYRVLNVDFGGLSESRNNAIHETQGTYVTFLDADDLVSANWFLAGYQLATESRVIVHPEYSITFGDDNLIWQKVSSSDPVRDTLSLIDNNLWDSPCLAQREIFIKHPYVPNGNGFGFEDKQFNSETLADNIPHVVAPHTILFVRRKLTGSMLMQGVADRVTLAPTELLAYDRIAHLPIETYITDLTEQPAPLSRKLLATSRSKAKHIAKKLHNRAKQYELYTRAVRPLREKRQAHLLAALHEQYPTWMADEWQRIHRIDNTIFPSKELLKHLPWYNSQNILPGIKYSQLIQSFSRRPDTLMFVPHLIKGGADMLFINYPNELIKLHPDWHIAALQTEAKESVWRNKLAKDIDFVDIFKLFEGLDQDTQFRILATLITQNSIRRIIIGNSQLAYDFVSKYQTLIKRLDIAIYCFAFGEEFDEEGRLWGHIHTGIPRIYPVIHRIITDNQNTINKLELEYAFDRDKFRAHYQPTAVTICEPVIHDHTPLKVLWASRICKQKRPDILKNVSNLLDPTEFTFDAYGQLEEGLTPEYFNNSRVTYRGAFNGIATLPTDQYDVFLYTSEGDGVPNVLQEMTASGLPIVASNVGGIREFVITNKTGILIENHNNIEGYVTAIKQLRDTSLRRKLIDGAQHLLQAQFSYKTWLKHIENDFDK
jgi:glycosyltransferase involved in cell wall biosynthesis